MDSTETASSTSTLPIVYEVRTNPPDSDKPSSKWNIDKLKAYAQAQFVDVMHFGRKTAVAMFRSGHALSLIQNKLKAQGAWSHWQDDNGFNRGTVARAIRFFVAAKKEERIAEKTFAAAFAELCGKPPKKKGEQHKRKRKNVPRSLDDLDTILTEWSADPQQANSEQLDGLELKLTKAIRAIEAIRAKQTVVDGEVVGAS